MLADYQVLEEASGNNFFDLDPNLDFQIRMKCPTQAQVRARDYLRELGELMGKVISPLSEVVDKNPPTLVPYDHWGLPRNEVVHHPAWLEIKSALVRHGFTNISEYCGAPMPGVVNAAANYLLSQTDTAALCALGMTVAAAGIIERYAPPEIRQDYLARLRSLDPSTAWEAGMFLTERQGGSDVGANTTTAVADGNQWRIFGEKFFCSNVDAEVFIVLARPEGGPPGSRGLATYIVPRLLPDGSPNNFEIKRLKPKLGTRGVPTGEVLLKGSIAYLAHPGTGKAASEKELALDRKGIVRMMEMVNASRFGVALMGLGIHRRAFLEAAIYAARRVQFGQRIDAYPMVRKTLVDMLADLEANLALTFDIAAIERLVEGEETALVLRRVLIPLAKIISTRRGLLHTSAALEVLGGNGYMEDWPLARLLRDAQCHPIWEGTENILCIDFRRALRTVDADNELFPWLRKRVEAASDCPVLADAVPSALGLVEFAEQKAKQLKEDEASALADLREIAFLVADLSAFSSLAAEAEWEWRNESSYRKALLAHRFYELHLERDRFIALAQAGPAKEALSYFDEIVRYGKIVGSSSRPG